jgi:hypothetical protein
VNNQKKQKGAETTGQTCVAETLFYVNPVNPRLMMVVNRVSKEKSSTFSRGLYENLLWSLFTEKGIDCKYLSVLEGKALSLDEKNAVVEYSGQKRQVEITIDFFVDLLKALENTGEIIFVPKSELSFYNRQKMAVEGYGSSICVEGQLYFLSQEITNALQSYLCND